MTCRRDENFPAPECEEEVISKSHDDVESHCSTVASVRPHGRALAERHTTFATEEVQSEAPRGGIPSDEMLMPSEAEEAVVVAPIEPPEVEEE